MLNNLKRILKLAWINFTRNLGLSLVAVFAITITLLFLTFALIAKNYTESVSLAVRDQVSVTVYFKDGVDEETVFAVQEELRELPEIREVNYISKQAALESFIIRHKDNAVLMAALAEVGNPFLPSLNVIAESPAGYEMAVSFLQESPSRVFFEKIDYAQRKILIQDIFRLTSTVQQTLLVIAGIMALISVLLVFNIIRLALYGMREELSILRLVGVSRRYIAGSFIFQGMITGIAGVLATILVLVATTLIFGERIAGFIPGLELQEYLVANTGFLLLVQFGVAIFLAVFSSLIAVAKELKT